MRARVQRPGKYRCQSERSTLRESVRRLYRACTCGLSLDRPAWWLGGRHACSCAKVTSQLGFTRQGHVEAWLQKAATTMIRSRSDPWSNAAFKSSGTTCECRAGATRQRWYERWSSPFIGARAWRVDGCLHTARCLATKGSGAGKCSAPCAASPVVLRGERRTMCCCLGWVRQGPLARDDSNATAPVACLAASRKQYAAAHQFEVGARTRVCGEAAAWPGLAGH